MIEEPSELDIETQIEGSALPIEAQAVPDQPVAWATDLHQQIMNLPCGEPPADWAREERLAYRYGHKEARHAAAELVAASPAAADLRNVNPIGLTPAQKELQRQQFASPVAPVGAPTLTDEQIDNVTADVFGEAYRPHPNLMATHRRFARALLSHQGCELATDATKPASLQQLSEIPHGPHQPFAVMAQGRTDYILDAFPIFSPEHGMMLTIGASAEAVYVTREQAKAFFALQDSVPALRIGIPELIEAASHSTEHLVGTTNWAAAMLKRLKESK